MDILRKSFAPISEEAWDEINEEAIRTLKALLSARKVVDVEGPKGLDYPGVPLGRLSVPGNQTKDAVHYGVHQTLPMVEARIPFELDIWELDNLARGAEDIDLDNVQEAARKLSVFEDDIVFNGLKEAKIQGLLDSTEYEKIQVTGKENSFAGCLAEALVRLRESAVEGPYNLVLGADLYQCVTAYKKEYPLIKHIENLIEGKIVYSRNLKGALLLSARGGDFELTLGQDVSIGYEAHDNKKVKLFLTESLTFRVLDPAAVIVFV